VESTVNVVVDKRFAKKQQMQWSKLGAHRMVQVRPRTLDGTLRKTFAWYPGMAPTTPRTPRRPTPHDHPRVLHALQQRQ